jgi:uncharacterized membrane-anchored protein YitT (DUF2179 family)
LLLTTLTPLPFAAMYLAVNVPFVLLPVLRRGWHFIVRSMVSVALLAGFSYMHPLALPLTEVEPVHAVLLGNLLIGVGILVLFRYGYSLGGSSVVAPECQDRFGWRAGYVQLACDKSHPAAALPRPSAD